MSNTKFAAVMYDGNFRCAKAEFDTITAARQWAESYGATADKCLVFRAQRGAPDRIVAAHTRDTSNDGTRWFKAQV